MKVTNVPLKIASNISIEPTLCWRMWCELFTIFGGFTNFSFCEFSYKKNEKAGKIWLHLVVVVSVRKLEFSNPFWVFGKTERQN